MATTGVNICKLLVAALVGSTQQLINTLTTMNPTSAKQQELAGNVLRLDRVHIDLSNPSPPTGDTGGYAKNGGSTTTLSGTTAVTLSLLDLTSNSTSSTGDTVFATWNQLIIKNTGAADITLSNGGSNPAHLGLAGTNPTLTIPAGSAFTLQSAAGLAVDSTHCNLVITPTSGGSVGLCVGGA